MRNGTIVAAYGTAAQADAAAGELNGSGIPAEAIDMHAGADGTGEPLREPGFWARVFGAEPEQEGGRRGAEVAAGSIVMSVRAPLDVIPLVVRILERHGPVELDERGGAGIGAVGGRPIGGTRQGVPDGMIGAAPGGVAGGVDDGRAGTGRARHGAEPVPRRGAVDAVEPAGAVRGD